MTHKIFSAPPDETYQIITRLRVNYLALYGLLKPKELTGLQLAASL